MILQGAKNKPVNYVWGFIIAFFALFWGVELWFFSIKDNQNVLPSFGELMPMVDEASQPEPLADFSSYQPILARPIFSISRAPRQHVVELVDEEPLKEQWMLSAVINTGTSAYVIFSEVNGNRRLRLEKGMKLDGWQLVSLDTRRVELTRGGKSETFKLGEPRPGTKPVKQVNSQ